MANFYTVISKAIADLGPGAPAPMRDDLYRRARTALLVDLRARKPPLSEMEITSELFSLEEAVHMVEETVAKAQLDPNIQQVIRASEASRSSRMLREQQEDARRRVAERLSALSEAQLKRQIAQTKASKPQRRPKAPPVTAIPAQNLRQAIGFHQTRRGPLDLVSDPPRDPADPEQNILYERIRSQLQDLKRTIPSQERGQIDTVVDDFLEQPANWHEVEFKKILWLCGNSLRTLLTQHDAVKNDSEPHYSKLPPSVAEALRRPIQAWNIFVQGDPDLAELDARRLGPQEQSVIQAHLAVAEQLIAVAAADRKIATERAEKALVSSLAAARDPDNNINTRLAQDLADKTSKNFFSQLLRRAYLIRDAIIDPNSEAAKNLTAEFVKGASKAAGGATLLFLGSHALSFFEFVATNPILIKQYIAIAFQNVQMAEIVDAIEFEYQRLKKLAAVASKDENGERKP
jgi:hypothetical protein